MALHVLISSFIWSLQLSLLSSVTPKYLTLVSCLINFPLTVVLGIFALVCVFYWIEQLLFSWDWILDFFLLPSDITYLTFLAYFWKGCCLLFNFPDSKETYVLILWCSPMWHCKVDPCGITTIILYSSNALALSKTRTGRDQLWWLRKPISKESPGQLTSKLLSVKGFNTLERTGCNYKSWIQGPGMSLRFIPWPANESQLKQKKTRKKWCLYMFLLSIAVDHRMLVELISYISF